MDRMARLNAYLIVMVVAWLVVPVWAQSNPTPTPPATAATSDEPAAEVTAAPELERIVVRVRVEDAFVRLAPSRDAPRIGSVFLDDPLELVGRNYNGLWYEVRRPYRDESLGWIFNSIVSDLDVLIEYLPLTDNITGIEGDRPLVDTGVAVFTLAELEMREQPNLQAAAIGQRVPQSTTAQVIYRNQDGSWLFVNYNGYTGWIATFLIRENDALATVPLAPNLPPLPLLDGLVIPPEIQLEQVQRLRDYVIISGDLAEQLKYFWQDVARGEVMPCETPGFVMQYPYTAQDVQELPELGRLVPRIDDATAYLNDAIDPLTQCGVFDRTAVASARNGAINAEIIFDDALNRIAQVEETINSQIDK